MKRVQRFLVFSFSAGVLILCGILSAGAAEYKDEYGIWNYTVKENEEITINYYSGSETEVVIPSEIEEKPVTNIRYGAFENHYQMTSVKISDNVNSIESYAFAYCRRLTSVIIPDSMISIEGYAFHNCLSLTSIDIPAGVTFIGYAAFSACFNLFEVKFFSEMPPVIGEYVFENVKAGAIARVPAGWSSYGIAEGSDWHGLIIVYNAEIEPPAYYLDLLEAVRLIIDDFLNSKLRTE